MDRRSGMRVLAVDIGTTAMKMGVFDLGGPELTGIAECSRGYAIRTYNDGLYSDVDTDLWKTAFVEGCGALGPHLRGVEAVCLSGTTPGLTALDADGGALCPAILMLDQRSRAQATRIIDTVGLEQLLSRTGNMPVAGGCSLAGMLWIKENAPEVYRDARWFVHSNGLFCAWLTGAPAMDPSSASLTGVYRTVPNDLSWDLDIARACGADPERLPPLLAANLPAGALRRDAARATGLRQGIPVIVGGNDAVLAAHSMGVREPGEVVNVNGTCEVSLVCLSRCRASASYNVRAHVVPRRWLTLYVMNAEGKAYEWFRSVFCSELSGDEFYSEFLPRAVDRWLGEHSDVTYVPYLLGSRYSLEPLRAEFTGITGNTTREELAAAMVRGLCGYQRMHLEEVGALVPLRPPIRVTGGALSDALIRAKQRWMHPGEYVRQDQSSLRGAALLGREYLTGSADPGG